MACLLYGTAHPALGADDDLEYLVGRLRAVWPDVQIEIRADAGFGVPWMFDACERMRVDYTFGKRLNPVLKTRSDARLAEAVQQYERTGQPQRLFCAFWYQACSWPQARWCIVKTEAHARATNRRAVITNRPGAFVLPQAAYDAYADRGESENRNKELKCGLQADRLSDHRFLANYFRLYRHATALNLLTRLRREVADPPPESQGDLPVEALPGRARRAWFNHRRQRDPLGEGHPATWQTRLIKGAAQIVVSRRRILVRLSAFWPYLEHSRRVAEVALRFPSLLPARPG